MNGKQWGMVLVLALAIGLVSASNLWISRQVVQLEQDYLPVSPPPAPEVSPRTLRGALPVIDPANDPLAPVVKTVPAAPAPAAEAAATKTPQKFHEIVSTPPGPVFIQ